MAEIFFASPKSELMRFWTTRGAGPVAPSSATSGVFFTRQAAGASFANSPRSPEALPQPPRARPLDSNDDLSTLGHQQTTGCLPVLPL